MTNAIRRLAILGVMAAALPGLAAAPKASPDPKAELETREKKLKEDRKDLKDWMALADFCELHGLWPQREEILRKVTGIDPDHAEAHGRLDEGRFEGAWMPIEEAEAKEAEANEAKGLVYYGTGWVAAKEAGKLRAADRKKVGWDLDRRIDTPHLAIYSNRDHLKTRRMAGILENTVATYQRFMGGFLKLQSLPAPMKVYLCADRPTLDKAAILARGSAFPDGVGGAYVKSKILLIGCGADGIIDEGNYVHCGVHELIHGLDDQMARFPNTQSPIWLFEGLAEHWAYSVSGRQVLPGKGILAARVDMHPRVLEHSLEKASIPALVKMDQNTFMQQDSAYPHAWGVVNFLLHGEEGRHAGGFKAYVRQIKESPGKASLEACLKVKLPALDEAFRTHVTEVMLPSVKRFD